MRGKHGYRSDGLPKSFKNIKLSYSSQHRKRECGAFPNRRKREKSKKNDIRENRHSTLIAISQNSTRGKDGFISDELPKLESFKNHEA